VSAVERYLAELRRELPFWVRRRVLAEVEDHLRESAAIVGEAEAVERFGPPREVARGFRHVAALQLAAAAALVALLLPVLSYPLVENALPPAPWPSAAAMPDSLQWKLDAIKAFYLLALVAGAVAAFLVRKPGRDLVLACAVVLAALAHVGALSTVLSVQWEGAVTGTPGWLRLVAVAQLIATVGAAALLVRAARPRPA
jgi:HAAS